MQRKCGRFEEIHENFFAEAFRICLGRLFAVLCNGLYLGKLRK
jgi:hypothetical protein